MNLTINGFSTVGSFEMEIFLYKQKIAFTYQERACKRLRSGRYTITAYSCVYHRAVKLNKIFDLIFAYLIGFHVISLRVKNIYSFRVFYRSCAEHRWQKLALKLNLEQRTSLFLTHSVIL